MDISDNLIYKQRDHHLQAAASILFAGSRFLGVQPYFYVLRDIFYSEIQSYPDEKNGYMGDHHLPTVPLCLHALLYKDLLLPYQKMEENRARGLGHLSGIGFSP